MVSELKNLQIIRLISLINGIIKKEAGIAQAYAAKDRFPPIDHERIIHEGEF